jgi:ADP-ribose pyrophosphatase YjhB (NUDIX family)
MESFDEKLKAATEAGYNIGACIRVRHGDAYLLLRRSATDIGSGVYEMPGGSVDYGERLEEAAARELFEESGIVVEANQLVPLGIFEFHNVETGKHKTKFTFDVVLDSIPTITLSDDHDEAVFMTLSEIDALNQRENDGACVVWKDHYDMITLGR